MRRWLAREWRRTSRWEIAAFGSYALAMPFIAFRMPPIGLGHAGAMCMLLALDRFVRRG